MLGPDLSVLIFIGTLPTLLCNIPPLPPVSLWGPLAGCVCVMKQCTPSTGGGSVQCTVRVLYTCSLFIYWGLVCVHNRPPPPLLSAIVQGSSVPAFIEAGWYQRCFIYTSVSSQTRVNHYIRSCITSCYIVHFKLKIRSPQYKRILFIVSGSPRPPSLGLRTLVDLELNRSFLRST